MVGVDEPFQLYDPDSGARPAAADLDELAPGPRPLAVETTPTPPVINGHHRTSSSSRIHTTGHLRLSVAGRTNAPPDHQMRAGFQGT